MLKCVTVCRIHDKHAVSEKIIHFSVIYIISNTRFSKCSMNKVETNNKHFAFWNWQIIVCRGTPVFINKDLMEQSHAYIFYFDYTT